MEQLNDPHCDMLNNDKRPKSILSSNETEDEKPPPKQLSKTMAGESFDSVLKGIEGRLQKQEKLDSLMLEVEAFKKGMTHNNALIEQVQEENKRLHVKVESLLNTTIKDLNEIMKETLLDLQCRSMRNNVVIIGLKEGGKNIIR